jgi:hypothetical protein
MTYILVNPVVHNNQISSNEGQSGGAAEAIWTDLSTHVKKYAPEFLFTIQNTDNKKLYHYMVKENMEGGKVKFVISQYTNVDKDVLAKGDKDEKMDGGRRRHDSSSSSSSSSSSDSDSDYVYMPSKKSRRRRDNGLTLTYYPSIYGMSNVLLPTFSTAFAPLGVNIKLNSGLPTVITYGDNYLGTYY